MHDLFIPPFGAMQFEMTNTPANIPAHVWAVPDFYTGEQKAEGCKCSRFFRVIATDQPKVEGYNHIGHYLCLCTARIIE